MRPLGWERIEAELEPALAKHREQLQKAAPVGRDVGDSATVVDLVARGLARVVRPGS